MKFLDRIVPMLLLCALALPAGCAASPDEDNEFAQREAAVSAGATLYQREDFAALDRLLEQLRKDRSRTSSGLWRSGLTRLGILESEPTPRDEAQWREQEARARRWVQAQPGSANASLNLAEQVLRHARAIGCGRCTVQDEAKRPALFEAELARASKLVAAASGVPGVDPQWYADSLDLARMEHRTPAEVERTVAELSTIAPGYYPAWFGMVDFLLEESSPASPQIEALARRAMAASSAEEGRSMYARVWWYAAQKRYGEHLFDRTPVKWADFDAAFRDVMERYPDDWNRNNYANFACNAGHPERAREIMQGHEPMQEAWDSFELYESCVDIAPLKA